MISSQTHGLAEDQLIRGESLDSPNSRTASVGETTSVWPALGLTLGLYASMVLFTRPLSFGDSIFYVQAILAFHKHSDASTLRLLLDFGHLLWRPLGLVLYDIVRTVPPLASSVEDRILVLKVLMGISILSGAVATAMLHLICRDLGFRNVVSFLTCATFTFSNAVIYAAQTGLSYMLGLALLTAALWLTMRRPAEGAKEAPTGLWWAGILLAFSAATWFPFALVAPAVAAAAAIRWNESELLSIRGLSPGRAVHVIGAGIVGGATIFGVGAWVLHINSTAGIRAWISGSAHGWRQSSNILRLGMGLPRCCVALKDNAGVVWKRYLFHDPYAPVKPHELLQSSLLLMVAFYFGLLLLLYTLFKSNRGRVFLALLTIAGLPVLYFGLFLFEPSSIERFIPVFPFYFVALGYQLQFTWRNPRQRSLALIYPAVLILSTLATYNNWSVERYWRPARMRLEALAQQLPVGSAVALLGNWDDIFLFSKDNPLHDNFSDSVDLWVLLQPAHERIFCWRELFASRVAEAWAGSREMWLSERLLSPIPRPEWEWVEGDDPAIHWPEVPEFFREFQFDLQIGHSDGFVRLASTKSNRLMLDHLAHEGCKAPARAH